MIDIEEIKKEYQPNNDIFNEEDEMTIKVKDIIYNILTETDRRIILLYAKEQSMRKVAKHLGVSTATAYNTITRIRNIIKGQL